MADPFAPINLDLIEEGRFKRAVEVEFMAMRQELIRYVREYGGKAAKAKGVLTIKIAVAIDSVSVPEKGEAGEPIGDYSVKSTVTKSLPGRPADPTRVLHSQDQDGSEDLFCRKSGSTPDTPRQARLATQDGRPIDIESGEVKDVNQAGDGRKPKKDK